MALIPNGRVALICFAMGFGLYVSSFMLRMSNLAEFTLHYTLFYMALANALAYVIYQTHYDVAVRALWLGIGLSGSVAVATSSSPPWSGRLLGWYIAALCVFHWGEYFVTAVSNPRNLKLESFLLDHSREYHLAIIASFIEFIIEWLLFPSLKQPSWVSIVGLVIVFSGDLLRKLAMLTAKTNFNHYIQYSKSNDHELVTSGIYAWTRHPSYVGWFYWSFGNQIMLCNPLCTIAFAIASWRFFQERIYTEEMTLVSFFGQAYLDYQKKVGTGIPFVNGYNVEVER
jgi:protein-S-isoprenylcysteine O-methyltransferase